MLRGTKESKEPSSARLPGACGFCSQTAWTVAVPKNLLAYQVRTAAGLFLFSGI